jgi:hypothetical protein
MLSYVHTFKHYTKRTNYSYEKLPFSFFTFFTGFSHEHKDCFLFDKVLQKCMNHFKNFNFHCFYVNVLCHTRNSDSDSYSLTKYIFVKPNI